MIVSKIPLVDWGTGVIMIGVFALVCVLLIGWLVYFVTKGSNKEEKE